MKNQINNITLIKYQAQEGWFINIGNTGTPNAKQQKLINKKIIFLQKWIDKFNEQFSVLEDKA